ncbi:WD repeat-containing protein 74 [Sesamum angolense]|uniref:WD repeat-containing protein 74 n=1 Tax=Sesamum angolense TaxID=2727404 RepID=A0AAE2C6G5_9LAMI|nr:WD repeat-containing protein 74 [Sesamum angolense]
MPRTTTVESPGCPPLRALTFDVLGLVKVIEASDGQNGGAAKMVERWGDPDSSKCVLAASMVDRESDPVCRLTFLLLVLHGNAQNATAAWYRTEMWFRHASMESIELGSSPADAIHDRSPTTWNVCASGNILCSKVDENENYALYGGKSVEVNVWDLHECVKIWTAKSPPQNSLGIFTPTCFTSATFLSKDDHRKLVAGTDSHQVRLYDISAQRRPVMSVDFRETAIKAVAEDVDGRTIYIGNGSGDLASIDIRTGKLLGCFIGKCSGSIRSIARHPELPVIASCGLDSYLRIWDIKSRQLLSAVFLKQHLTSVVFDSHFRNKEVAGSALICKRTSLHDAMRDQYMTSLLEKIASLFWNLDIAETHSSSNSSV